MNQTPSQQRVVIVGGGFGGLRAARELSKNPAFSITLISDKDTFRYYPTLFKTATGGLYAQSNIPLANILDPSRVTVVQGSVKTLNRHDRTIVTTEGQAIGYEVLILALGVVINYFGIDGLEQFTYGIKTQEQTQAFKNHLHQQLETEHAPDLNYVIVGAGPTGIELAGALPGYLHKLMKSHGITDVKPHITIIEAADRLLPRSSEKVSKAVEKRLRDLGVSLKLGQKVEGATADNLMVNGQPIESHTIVWTAGTSNHAFFKENNFALNERGKVIVDQNLRAEEAIYVLGDNAATPFSGVAQTALYDGLYAAHDIVRRSQGKPSLVYKPEQPISVIPVGYGWATIEWGKKTFTGMLGWMLREIADWRNYHKLEPFWGASEQWMTEFGHEEDCPTCAPQGTARPNK
jgi:NADH:ubiquinone reductase (H+-translocating)